MFDIYARTLMTASRAQVFEAPCTQVKAEKRRTWFHPRTRCIALDKL